MIRSGGEEDDVRVGIIGAGISGLVTAWLLDGHHEVLVLEERERVGGNLRSVSVRLPAGELNVDLGVHSFSRGLFPAHTRLLELLGLVGDHVAEVPMSLTLRRAGTSDPLLVTPHSRDADAPGRQVLGPAWEAVGAMLERGAKWREEGLSWGEPYASLVEPLPVPETIKRDVLYAWPAALFSCSLDQMREMSARAVLEFYLEPAEPPPGEAVRWQNLRGGAESLAWALAAGAKTTDVRTNAGPERLRRAGEGFELDDRAGGRHRVDHLVFATPPDITRELLAQLAGTESLREALSAFTYAPIVVGAHTDASWMPPRREQWSTDNVLVTEDAAVSTRWCGPAHGLRVFTTRLPAGPLPMRGVLAQSSFRQMRPTPAAMLARDRLTRFQGAGNVHLAGAYTQGVDSQENAVRSGIRAAADLVPADSPRLTGLTA
ncbi:FAD-dependent oxidoreductase [Bailinhaonella thermotolerans]|uniref:FAD-dependent oxidoreductase n=1 Tax=Bailinhaonella thermotolerans TaxID=1070861 RepID=UPI001A8CFAAD|nr:FAD-dependent oxidoreductase [Bailinhaonella thermotolerans]